MGATSNLVARAFLSVAFAAALLTESVQAQGGSSICARSPEQGSCPTLPACPTAAPPIIPNCEDVPTRSLCKIAACPPGEHLWEPQKSTCQCVSSENACEQLADITQVGTRRFHANTNGMETLDSFVQTVGSASEVISDESRLNVLSPCVERTRERCTAMFQTQAPRQTATGFASYRKDNQFEFLDTCIASALQVMTGNSGMAYRSGSEKTAYIEWGTSGFVYNDCAPVETWKQELLDTLDNCGRGELVFNELTSPISLLWNQDVKIEDVVSRSKFPLNPKEAGKWFVWHASGHTPLVVWDPEHKGVITAANQLFGSHTWDKEWKSGYDALATLDADQSGWLGGAELAKLALWFDFNQDGISDAGEVKTLESVGVTALGVKPSHQDPNTRNIFAKEGFRRNIHSQEIIGASVDWFTGSTDERLGLEARYPNLQAAVLPVSSKATTADTVAGDFAGMWDWRAVDRASGELPENLPSGSLILYDSAEGIAGSAYSVAQYAPHSSGIAERVVRTKLKGKTENVQGGVKQLLFTATTQYGGAVQTVARLSEDKKLLFGITTEEVGPKKEKVQYQWVATRYIAH